MKNVQRVLLATSTMAAAALSAGLAPTVVAPTDSPQTRTASAGKQRVMTTDSTLPGTKASTNASHTVRGQWLQVRATRRCYPTWTGTHKQNRRKQMKRNRRRRSGR